MPATQVPGVEALLRPRAIAVVGASPRAGFAATVLDNLERHGFAGAVHLVNPRYDELDGRPCHAAVVDIEDDVDLALLFVPAAVVPTALVDAGKAGVRAVIIYASGFSEAGEAGRALQAEVAQIATEYGMRVLGPNCQGLYFGPGRLAAAFTPSLTAPLRSGSGVAYVGQSGAMGGALMGMLRERGVDLAAWASVGNQVDLSAAELMGHLVEQDEIRVIAAYLETVPDGGQWQALTTRACETGTRLVVLRSGRSEAGRRAAASHTGALVRDDAAFELVNRRDGVLEVHDVEELADVVEALAAGRHLSGPRLAVITSSGGAGCLFADHLADTRLELAALSDATQARLADLVPGYGSWENPVDVTAQLFVDGGSALGDVCRAVADDGGVDALVVLVTSATGDLAARLGEALATMAADTTKPVSVVWLAGVSDTWSARAALRAGGAAVSSSIASTVRTLSLLHTVTVPSTPSTPSTHSTPRTPGLDAVELPSAVDRLLPWLTSEARVITEATGTPVLDALGIDRPPSRLARSRSEAEAAGAELGGDAFVVKIQSPQILHKTEVGGVRVGVGADALAAAYDEVAASATRIPECHTEGVLVQRVDDPGPELVVGVRGASDGYPAVVTVGFGGIAVELYADVVSGLAPLTRTAARELLGRLRSWPLLDGYRGRRQVSVDAAVDAVVAVASLADRLGESLEELEINPLRVHPDRATALDLLIRTTGRRAGA